MSEQPSASGEAGEFAAVEGLRLDQAVGARRLLSGFRDFMVRKRLGAAGVIIVFF